MCAAYRVRINRINVCTCIWACHSSWSARSIACINVTLWFALARRQRMSRRCSNGRRLSNLACQSSVFILLAVFRAAPSVVLLEFTDATPRCSHAGHFPLLKVYLIWVPTYGTRNHHATTAKHVELCDAESIMSFIFPSQHPLTSVLEIKTEPWLIIDVLPLPVCPANVGSCPPQLQLSISWRENKAHLGSSCF